MSILLDLLAKIQKSASHAGGVNPSLRTAVAAANNKGWSREKTMRLVLLGMVGFLAGGALLYYIEFMRPVPVTVPPRRSLPVVVQTQQSSARGATTLPVQEQISTSQHAAVQPHRSTVRRQPVIGRTVPTKGTGVAGQPKRSRPSAKKMAPPATPPAAAQLPPPATSSAAGNLSPIPAVNRDVVLLMARDAEMKKDLFQALRLYRQLLVSEPNNYRIHTNIAGICIQQGNYGDALAAARQALSIQSAYLPALINGGIASAHLGKDQEAAVSFGKVLAIEPHHRGALYNLALLREKSGGDEEAAALYRRLVDAGDLQGYLGLGRIEERLQRPAAARQAYRALLAAPGAPTPMQHAARERLRQLE